MRCSSSNSNNNNRLNQDNQKIEITIITKIQPLFTILLYLYIKMINHTYILTYKKIFDMFIDYVHKNPSCTTDRNDLINHNCTG